MKMPRKDLLKRTILTFGVALAALMVLLACGCGGGNNGGGPPPPPPDKYTISPTTTTVQTGGTQQFTFNKNGVMVEGDWFVNNVQSGNSTLGTIDISGLYTAPGAVPNPAAVTVKGCDRADTTKCATATVTLITPPPPPEKIAFMNQVANGQLFSDDIYLINPDGTGLQRLTSNSSQNLEPSFSPDGKQIAFNTTRDGDNAIYIMNVDGSGQTRLNTCLISTLTNTCYSTFPAWSPDGNKIAFVYLDNNESGVAVINLATLNIQQLTHEPCPGDSCRIAERPSWSPDGKRIVFENSGADICLINADGSGFANLTNTAIHEAEPAWSPDGKTIAYMSQASGHWEIYLTNPDGTDVRKLTENQFGGTPDNPLQLGALYPAWSPDSGTIVYILNSSDGQVSHYQLYTISANGTGSAKLLPNSPDICGFPAWSEIK